MSALNSSYVVAALIPIFATCLMALPQNSPELSFREGANGSGLLEATMPSWPSKGKIALPITTNHITSIHFKGSDSSPVVSWIFNPNATRLELELPPTAPAPLPATLEFETAEISGQFPDGRIIFSAKDARVEGQTARLESHPGNHRIGYWTRSEDSVIWDYKPTRWGMYDVECTFSAEGGEGTEIEITIAEKSLTARRPSTGSWHRYQTLKLGRVYIARSAPFQVRVRGVKQTGAAVMNLKAITLRPAPEGNPIVQNSTGLITLHSRDAITHSVLMRYEPQTNKNCLGYWANIKDQAQWKFRVEQPGTYEVEVWQGCGTGQGGSDVNVESAGTRLSFAVEDTGHFQNFKPRKIGTIRLARGDQDLWIRPSRKQAGAVMDIHKILLIPVAGN